MLSELPYPTAMSENWSAKHIIKDHPYLTDGPWLLTLGVLLILNIDVVVASHNPGTSHDMVVVVEEVVVVVVVSMKWV